MEDVFEFVVDATDDDIELVAIDSDEAFKRLI